MISRTRTARRRSLAVLAVLALTAIQLQLVVVGTASAQNSACNGAFSGNPQGTLDLDANVANGAVVAVGQSITVTATWAPSDWSDLDQYHNCWRETGVGLIGSLELFEGNPNNDGTITQTITVPGSLSAGDELCVRGRLSGQPAGGNTTTQKSDTLCWTIGQPGDPDVIVRKSASQTNLTAGDQFSYTLEAENVGNADASNVVITDTIPASLNIVNAPASCNVNGQTVTCNVGTLTPGESVSRTITVQTTPASCPSVDNTGSVSAGNEPANKQGNNTSNDVTVNVTCLEPDVQVEKSASAANVNSGDSVTFTITARNTGGATANNVVITDTVPNGLTITDQSNSCTVAGQTVTCNVGNLAAGASTSIQITVLATDGACPSVNNQASVSAGNEPNSATGNNLSNTVRLNVSCPDPDVEIRKRSDAPTEGVFEGDRFTYTITVENVSGTDVNDVVVHDSIPAGLTIVDTSASCTVTGQDVACDLGTVAAGQQESVTITVEATAAACPEVTNQATVTASNDTVASNNTSDPVTDIVNCVEPGIAVRVTKVNDANGDGRYTDFEEAKKPNLDVPFRLVITNTGEAPWRITSLTDAFDQTTLDLLSGKCSQLDGVTLDPGESVKCSFTLNNYSPPSETTITNTVEVCVRMVGGDDTDCDDDPSRVRSAEVLGRTVTPPPTRTPPGGTAFTGPDDGTISWGLTAIALLLLGTGVLYAGYRKRERYDG